MELRKCFQYSGNFFLNTNSHGEINLNMFLLHLVKFLRQIHFAAIFSGEGGGYVYFRSNKLHLSKMLEKHFPEWREVTVCNLGIYFSMMLSVDAERIGLSDNIKMTPIQLVMLFLLTL